MWAPRAFAGKRMHAKPASRRDLVACGPHVCLQAFDPFLAGRQVGSANELNQYVMDVYNHPFLAKEKHRQRLDSYVRREVEKRKEGREPI